MSTQTYRPKGSDTNARAWLARALDTPDRALALLGVATLLAASLRVLLHIVDVAGNPTTLWLLAAAAVLAASALARVLRVRTAFVLGVGLLIVGLTWYVISLPYDPAFVAMLASNVELLSGRSMLTIERAPIWAIAVTPAPVFMAWFLALRRWYGTAVLVGGATLAYFVLTTDAGTTITLAGVLGGAAAIGFGDLDRRPGSGAAREYIVMVLAVMILVPALVSVVPGSAGITFSFDEEIEAGGTLEGDLLSTGGGLDVVGPIELTPEVRFTVEAGEPRRWRVGSYGRYTGAGWVRTGGTEPIDEATLDPPVGESERLAQEFQAESSVSVLPAAWRAVAVDGEPGGTTVANGDTLVPGRPLAPGDRYSVVSRVPTADAETLRDAGRDYPARVEPYLQLPDSMPDRVSRKTERLTAAASTPYDTARTIEAWLERNRDYSLDVQDPGDNVADAFLFEMEEGYCVYYATTMSVMLRSQGIPSRVVVGYTPGQEVADDSFVVRGYNSHAWVEAYFPDQGWVAFDPTPASERQVAEQARLEEARASSALMTVDARGSAPETTITTTPPTTTAGPAAAQNITDVEGVREALREEAGTVAPSESGGDGDADGGLPLPPRRQMALIAVALIGAVVGLRRTGLGARLYRSAWLRYQPRRDPASDVERAYSRVLRVLETEHRQIDPGETPRQFFDAVDAGPRPWQVLRARERARHGGGIDHAEADDAVDLANRLVGERIW
ncbi:MAG: transglutaminase domain-containing protein [Haloarculaceae archaeon]